MSAREVARRVLERIDRGGAWATPTLDGELARAGLSDRDRRLASELVYGVLRFRSRLDRIIAAHCDLSRTPARVLTPLRLATYQLLFLDRVPDYAAVDDAVSAARAIGGAKLAGFSNAVLRKISQTKEPPLPPEGRARIEIEYALPSWIVDELAAVVPAERLAEVAGSFAEPAPLVARANRLKATRDELIADFAATGATATPVDVAPPGDAPGESATPTAMRLENLGDPGRNPSFQSGRWTVQDTGAQLVGHVASPTPGMRILDACAGVGGKSTHLAELSDDGATIDAADQSTTKLELSRQTSSRLGLHSITTYACDLLDPKAPIGRSYDLILLDAPCTGLGVLRRHPDAKWRLAANDVPRLASIQAKLLESLIPRLAPGGTLVYSVCTFTRAEGPEQVAKTGLRLVDERRTWPADADAFYIARLQR